MDWHNTQCELVIKSLQREHHLKITSCFVNIIVRAKCVAIMLEWNCHQRFGKKTKTKYLVKSLFPCNFKTGNLKSLIGRERPRDVLLWKTHVQSVQICLFSNFIVKYANCWRSRFLRRHGYLSSLSSFPHGPPLRIKRSLLLFLNANYFLVLERTKKVLSDWS